MTGPLIRFLLFWGVNTLSLWVAAQLFPTAIGFTTVSALLVSGLLLGLMNTLVKPVLVILTLPISIITLGLFVLVVNAATLLFVAWLVPGFSVAGFLAGLGVALFISVFSFIVNTLLGR